MHPKRDRRLDGRASASVLAWSGTVGRVLGRLGLTRRSSFNSCGEAGSSPAANTPRAQQRRGGQDLDRAYGTRIGSTTVMERVMTRRRVGQDPDRAFLDAQLVGQDPNRPGCLQDPAR